MSAYYCNECERVRNVRSDGYEDVGNNQGVCASCAYEMADRAVAELMEHWRITAPASEVTEGAEGLEEGALCNMELVDLLDRLKDLKGEQR